MCHALASALPQEDPSSERETAWSSTPEARRTLLRRLEAWHQWGTDRHESLGKLLIGSGIVSSQTCHGNLMKVSLVVTPKLKSQMARWYQG